MSRRSERQRAIRQLVRTQQIHTQNEIVRNLGELGFDCTQTTISRDIADMGLLKSDRDFYQLPEDKKLSQLVSNMVKTVECAKNIIVVHTYPGSAPAVAGAIDAAALDHVLGTIAGDDTIFILANDATSARQVGSLIDTLVPQH
ncbi:arginine repressor [Atopobium sp. oral taxon 416]|uniref:arginine repressor n=1 Tax=Atopobium sp. oral taxon 416 TaxID=712157 RepID=UPI001BAC719F|nr:ArgR family transcriptional regulator [Atopobium sp. oral taxon 416]QUC02214.1 ArgR family transcriptional regulator [Atopobium sp. oral taxon 416]